MAIEADGTMWIGGGNEPASFDGSTWQTYDAPIVDCWAVAIDDDGVVWFGNNFTGVHVKWGGDVYPIVDGAQWLDPTHWRASYDVNALVPRDDYLVDIHGAVGSDGVEIAPVVGYTFTVDYAGGVTDQTPPEPPSVSAWGDRTDPTIVEASWSASDPDSQITLYRYAIGTTPGGTDVVNWTETTDVSMTRSGLGLIEGGLYHISVRARNTGGLWSDYGHDWFFAGEPPNTIFLPLVLRD